jgi:hypothetical protein
MPERINHLATWVAAIAYFLLGWVWYAFLFGGPWMTFMGKTSPNMSPMVSLYVESFVLGLILSYATAIALARRSEDQTMQQGISFALFMGIAIYATQSLNHALYESTPLGLWAIDTGYVLVGFAIIGAIVGGWKKSK